MVMGVIAARSRAGLTTVIVASLLTFFQESRGASFTRVEGGALGPSVKSITAVLKDRAGFLWIGSRDGLMLYDGYSAIVFEHDLSDPSSISDSYIRVVFEDTGGTIWVGTNSAGLARLDRDSWTFQHFRHDSRDPDSLPHDSVYAVVEDRDGDLWVGTQAGLARLDPLSGRFTRFPAGPEGPGSDFVVAMHVERNGTLWIATALGGLSRRDPETGRFHTWRHDETDAGSIPSDGVFAIAADAHERLWLATGAGVCWLDAARREFRSAPFSAPGTPSHPLATSVVVDVTGEVWATTLGYGLFRLRWKQRGPVFERHPFLTSRNADSAAPIWSVLADEAGNIWLGTWGEGLGRVSPGSRVLGETPRVRESGEVTAVFVDGQSRLWLGFLGEEVEIHALGTPVQRIKLPATPLRIAELGGYVYVGTTSGLIRRDPRTGATRVFANDRNDPGSLGAGWVFAVHEDRKGRVWVSTGEDGLNLLTESGTFERFTSDPDDPESISDDYVTSIAEDRMGVLWAGTRSGGLSALDETTRRFRRFLPDSRDTRSLGHHSVSAILVDRAGDLWIGTAGGGVDRVLRDSTGAVAGFGHFTERDGLISNNVVSLLEDDDGSIWIGTRKGLSRLEPKSRRFVSYGTLDGLISAELSFGTAAEGPDLLYFGSSEGLIAVRRGTPFPEVPQSPTVITSIRIVSGRESTERPVPVSTEITIPWRRILSFEFAVLDFGDRRRHRYSYRIAGRSDDWIELGPTREITFTDLSPGRYDLHVRGRNEQGVWTELATPLRIEVTPPFWMTAWFRTLVVVLVAGLVLAGHHIRLSSVERRRRQLEVVKDQREHALVEVRASQEALKKAYERLRWLTRRLEAAKEDERKRIAREIHDEMGQALTAAKINLKMVAGSESEHERDRHVADAIALLDSMIGHVRVLSLELRPPLLDDLGLAVALRAYVEALAKRTGKEIDLRLDPIPPGIPTEFEIAAFRIIQESLTNVLRHAEAKRVEVDVRYDVDGLSLSVSDDGRGFDVASVLDRAAAGEHLGLLGMKERVEGLGGVISIESSPRLGTSVRARLPLWLKGSGDASDPG